MSSSKVLYLQPEAGTELFVTHHGTFEVFQLSFFTCVVFGSVSPLVPFNLLIFLSPTQFNIILKTKP